MDSYTVAILILLIIIIIAVNVLLGVGKTNSALISLICIILMYFAAVHPAGGNRSLFGGVRKLFGGVDNLIGRMSNMQTPAGPGEIPRPRPNWT